MIGLVKDQLGGRNGDKFCLIDTLQIQLFNSRW